MSWHFRHRRMRHLERLQGDVALTWSCPAKAHGATKRTAVPSGCPLGPWSPKPRHSGNLPRTECECPNLPETVPPRLFQLDRLEGAWQTHNSNTPSIHSYYVKTPRALQSWREAWPLSKSLSVVGGPAIRTQRILNSTSASERHSSTGSSRPCRLASI